MTGDEQPERPSSGRPTKESGRLSWNPGQTPTGMREADATSATIFVILRRLRVPLITIISVFAIATVGLSLIPGVDADGEPYRMTLFQAFYFMSFTATTIGFGEIPFELTAAQRIWVIACIYMSVISWTYAIGTTLSLLQDRGYRQVRAVQRFAHRVNRLRSPFLLLAGYGRAGELLVQAFDEMGRQVVVLDAAPERIDELALGTFHADVPGLAGDASDPQQLRVAGLDRPNCVGVLALTQDDQVNLAVTMTAALLRPDIPVISHTITPEVAEQLRVFDSASVIDPFERFGDHMRLALHSPAGYQLMTWLEAGPGAALPPRGRPPAPGRWVLCGYGRLGRELTRQLRSAGVTVTVIDRHVAEPGGDPNAGNTNSGDVTCDDDVEVIRGDVSDPAVLVRARLDSVVGLMAGTDDDVVNLSALARARKLNPRLYLAGRQNRATNAELFEAMELDARLVPSEMVAHEVYARISSPLLWRFLRQLPDQQEAWAAVVIAQLVADCGHTLPVLWSVRLDSDRAPAVMDAVEQGTVRLGHLLRRPENRCQRLRIVPLFLLRASGEEFPAPALATVLEPGDQLLFAGGGRERRGLEATLVVESTSLYVLTGRRVAAGSAWRAVTRGRLTGGKGEPHA